MGKRLTRKGRRLCKRKQPSGRYRLARCGCGGGGGCCIYHLPEQSPCVPQKPCCCGKVWRIHFSSFIRDQPSPTRDHYFTVDGIVEVNCETNKPIIIEERRHYYGHNPGFDYDYFEDVPGYPSSVIYVAGCVPTPIQMFRAAVTNSYGVTTWAAYSYFKVKPWDGDGCAGHLSDSFWTVDWTSDIKCKSGKIAWGHLSKNGTAQTGTASWTYEAVDAKCCPPSGLTTGPFTPVIDTPGNPNPGVQAGGCGGCGDDGGAEIGEAL